MDIKYAFIFSILIGIFFIGFGFVNFNKSENYWDKWKYKDFIIFVLNEKNSFHKVGSFLYHVYRIETVDYIIILKRFLVIISKKSTLPSQIQNKVKVEFSIIDYIRYQFFFDFIINRKINKINKEKRRVDTFDYLK